MLFSQEFFKSCQACEGIPHMDPDCVCPMGGACDRNSDTLGGGADLPPSGVLLYEQVSLQAQGTFQEAQRMVGMGPAGRCAGSCGHRPHSHCSDISRI